MKKRIATNCYRKMAIKHQCHNMCDLPKIMNIEVSTHMIAGHLTISPEIARLIASVSLQFTDAMQNTNPTEYLIIDLTSVAPQAQWYMVDKLAERFGKVYHFIIMVIMRQISR